MHRMHIKYTHALPKLELRQADTYCSVVKIARIMPRTYDVDAHTDVGCEKFTRDLKNISMGINEKTNFLCNVISEIVYASKREQLLLREPIEN